jgi:hypothetical protein
MSSWRYFSLVHQNLTCDIMGIIGWFFFNIDFHIHYDYSFYMVFNCDTWHDQKISCDILIEFRNKKKNIYLFK